MSAQNRKKLRPYSCPKNVRTGSTPSLSVLIDTKIFEKFEHFFTKKVRIRSHLIDTDTRCFREILNRYLDMYRRYKYLDALQYYST